MKAKFKIRIFFLLLVGILSSLPARAEEYLKTIEVVTQGQVVPVEDLYLNPIGSNDLSRIKVKNGVEFYIQLPENHGIHDLTGGTIIEKNKILVSQAGTLRFRFFKENKQKLVRARVNYLGVLQLNGSDAPETIEVTEENKNSVLGVPVRRFPSIGWFSISDVMLSNVPVGTEIVTLKKLLESGYSDFIVKMYDGTSNQLPSGIGGGISRDTIKLINKRTIAPEIKTASLPEGKEGENYSFQLKAEGTNPISWSVVSGSLPQGLSLSSEGQISGTPRESGNFTFVVKASNEGGHSQKQFELIIKKKDLTPPTSFTVIATYQRDAIVSWQRGANETEWKISYGDTTVIVTEPKALLKGLEPNTDYIIEVRAKVGERYSESLEGKIKTEDLTKTHNRLPHLYGMKEVFSVKEVLPIFWKDMQKLPKKISYSLSPLSTSEEKKNKIFTPIPEAISFSEKGKFILTFKFEGHDTFEEIEYLLEIK